jgi:hypothetical protein
MNTKANELLWVTKAEYADEYKLLLTFNNDVTKLINKKKSLYGEVFEPLKDIEKFKQFELSDWTVEWNNGADFAPEYLFELNSHHYQQCFISGNHRLDKLDNDKDASVQLAVWRNGGSNPAENVVRN